MQSAPGVRIAYGVSGTGPAMVRVVNGPSHLQFNLRRSWDAHFREYAKSGRFIGYDPRGSGLSTRDVMPRSLSDFVADLSAVIDAEGLARTGLFAQAIGGPIAVRYAVLHPERVAYLILNGAWARGPSVRGVPIEFSEAFIKLVGEGWEQESAAFRHLMFRRLLTNASDEELKTLDSLHKVACAGEFQASIMQVSLDIDVSEDLPKLKCPTLIIHSLRDNLITFEEACRTASLIPGAKLEPIDSANNFALPSDPQFAKWGRLILDFARKHG